MGTKDLRDPAPVHFFSRHQPDDEEDEDEENGDGKKRDEDEEDDNDEGYSVRLAA